MSQQIVAELIQTKQPLLLEYYNNSLLPQGLQTVSFSDALSYQLPTFSELELELENIFGVVFERNSAAFSAHKASFDDALTQHFSKNVILPNHSVYCIKFNDKVDYIEMIANNR